MGKTQRKARKTGRPASSRSRARRSSGAKRARVPHATEEPAGAARGAQEGDFRQEKSIEELARDQGVRPVERFEDAWGRHADLWESDDEFERFVNGIYERRRREVAR